MNQPENKVIESIEDAVFRTLEDMAFEDVERAEEVERAPKDDNNQSVWANIPITTPVKGEIIIVTTPAYASSLVDSLFGEEAEGKKEALVHDAIKEVLNTIAGCFMTGLLAADKEYSIGFPVSKIGRFPIIKSEIEVLSFNIEEEMMTVFVLGKGFKKFRQP